MVDGELMKLHCSVIICFQGEPEKALKYLLKAYEADKRNFFALLDVLNILLGDVEANDKKIMDLFDSALDLEYFKRSKKNYASILLLKGLHEYLVSRKEASLEYFLRAYLEHEERSQEFLFVSNNFLDLHVDFDRKKKLIKRI